MRDPFHPRLNDNAIPRQQAGYYTKRIPCCLLLMDDKNHLVVHLDEIAAEVWKLCEASRTVGDIVETLRLERGEASTVQRDVYRVLDTLREYEAIDLPHD